MTRSKPGPWGIFDHRVRPEHFELAADGPASFHLRVAHVETLGADTLVHGHLGEDRSPVTIRLPDIQHLKKETELALSVAPAKIHLFDRETGRRIGP